MAHFHIKNKKGRPYLYVREIARVDGKPTVISQIYIGAPERVAALAQSHAPAAITLKAEEFGALWLTSRADANIDLVGIIDAIVPSNKNEVGPSVGEYFLYCIWNRMVHAVSKNALAQWYAKTAIQQIRPVDITQLNSQRYWEKWDRVQEKQLEKITQSFFQKLMIVEPFDADCLLFDTTNYYTFMESATESELAVRGKNKAGRHHLRQIGVGLLVARGSRLPLYYRVYPGNVHDSKLFGQIMDEMFGIICGLHTPKQRLTVVIDKGMNAQDNYAWIDDHQQIHFITTYSTYFAEELAGIPLDKFDPLDIEKNRAYEHEGKPEERILAYRTTGEYWGKQRSVIVTYNPASARKQNITFDAKLETLRDELLSMRQKVRDQEPHWRDKEKIEERYIRICERLHSATHYYSLEFQKEKNQLSMSFKKEVYQVEKKRMSFGKNIVVTDNTDWSTKDIVQANLDRWEVEDSFRLSKDDECVAINPLRHWTDSKIRCHIFSCVVAMTYLRRIELRLGKKGIHRSAQSVMEEMSALHSILIMNTAGGKPVRKLEKPTKTQVEVLSAFDHQISAEGVLQPLSP